MARRNNQELAFAALSIKGTLLAPDFLNKVAHLDAAEQSDVDYYIPRGLRLRDEIGRYWKIAQNLWQDFSSKLERADVDCHAMTVHNFLEPFCRQVLGFADLRAVGQVTLDERIFPIGFAAGDGRVSLVFAAHNQELDKSSARHGDGAHRRSPFLLAQEYLNANDNSLWALVSNGLKLRILRDNPSLTRPAYIEADLEAIFNEGLYADFSALWLLAHASRFGKIGAEPSDCALERWRNTAQEDGIRARDRLRIGVAEALRALGTGFLAHKSNAELVRSIETGRLSTQAYFEQLLRLVYRFIFLATIEDRELIFAPEATPEARERYHSGYSLSRLRQLAARRRSYDRHSDLWQVLTITMDGLGHGQPALGLPALGGLFEATQCPDIGTAHIENQALLSALFSLCFFRNGAALSRVNYRDMDSEELGSVYESLLELVPEVTLTGTVRKFGFIGDEEEGSTKGNARKLTGSYYTPDSLVQELIKSALEPVIARTLVDNPEEPVHALLKLTVCDPACGSGHFLLAAARRIADEVALLRAAEGNPTEDDFRHALRDVVAHCIYGVDKNPMAVELARTALWLEAYTPDRPLTFLDAHLRCGDALLGVLNDDVLQDGIPDKAFNALSGDDKDVVKRIKKANRDALKAIGKAAEQSRKMLSLDLGEAVDATAFEALPDDSLEAIQAKRTAHAALEASIATSRARLAADIFVAAFVLPKKVDTEARVPTSQDLWLVLNGDEPRVGVAHVAHESARAAQAFHWWQAFPQVKAKGGFDVLLGNPPWERIKLQEEEFFATRSPLVAKAQHKAERARRISLLSEGLLLHTLEPDVVAVQGGEPPSAAEQALYSEFLTARRNSEASSLFAHDGGRYPLTGVGDVNTYALFAESFAQLMVDGGRAGFIVPTGIATDDSTKAFFAWLTQTGRLASLYDIENRERLFPAVDSRMKFCLLTLGRSDAADFVCFATETSQLADPRRRFTLSPDEFSLINPNTLTCPVFRSERDAELTKKLYRVAPVLIRDFPQSQNAWGFDYMTKMFDMADSSHEFKNVEEISDISASNGSICGVDQSGEVCVPLFEAKNVHIFDHRWSSSVEEYGENESTKSRGSYEIQTRYWVPQFRMEERLASKDCVSNWLMGWRDITNATNERTIIASFFPRVAAAHTLRVMFVNGGAGDATLLMGCLSSLVLDYVARQKVGGTHLTVETLKQLPILDPSAYSTTDRNFITPRVLELVYVSESMSGLATELAFEGAPFAWNPERRAQLRAELDAYYARLYGLTRDELRYILDPADVLGEDYPSETFRVLKNNELREFGEYRTQRLVLAAWDRLEADLSDAGVGTAVFSQQGLIQNMESADFAGIVFEVIKHYPDGIAIGDLQALVAYALQPIIVSQYTDEQSAQRLIELMAKICRINVGEAVQLVPNILHRFQAAGVCRSKKYGDAVAFVACDGAVPQDVFSTPEHIELGGLLFELDSKRRQRAETEQIAPKKSDMQKGVA